jgi:branched-chain amino acid aminotransferase
MADPFVVVGGDAAGLSAASKCRRADRDREVIERAIFPEEFAKTDEVFICGTAVEVTPVSEIGPYNFQVGDITKTLMTDFDNMVWHRDAA